MYRYGSSNEAIITLYDYSRTAIDLTRTNLKRTKILQLFYYPAWSFNKLTSSIFQSVELEQEKLFDNVLSFK